jgi:fructosamine-3-kinase
MQSVKSAHFAFCILHFALNMVQHDELIREALALAGDTTPPREQALVGGGSISRAIRLRSDRGAYLLKTGGRGLPGFFAAEARGLELLAATATVRVPHVLAYRDAKTETGDLGVEASNARQASSLKPQASNSGFILLEWLAAPPHADRARAAMLLGHQLAALHRAPTLRQARGEPPAYGLDHDNYIGATPQPNGWMASWLAFFRERRLRFQADLARRHGLLPGVRARRLERLLERLDAWIDDQIVQPALLHGDLWGGNFIVGPGGAPALIDPAASYGDREADLAFTALCGGVTEGFYRAYQEAWPLPAGWQERRDLYNLYHLLNHLNLFGESYSNAVDRVLRRYVG